MCILLNLFFTYDLITLLYADEKWGVYMDFKVVSDYKPTGDQPEAINKLTEGVLNNYKYQTLLGVTGSGKTFTIANLIENVQKPTLVIAHNKTLAAQLCSSLKNFS